MRVYKTKVPKRFPTAGGTQMKLQGVTGVDAKPFCLSIDSIMFLLT